jgi:hypothetical protein
MPSTNSGLKLPGELSYKGLLRAVAYFALFDVTVYSVSATLAKQSKPKPVQSVVDEKFKELEQRSASADSRLTTIEAQLAGAKAAADLSQAHFEQLKHEVNELQENTVQQKRHER